MIKDFLINHGEIFKRNRIFFQFFAAFILIFLGAFNTASAQSIEDSIDDDKISVGESTTIRHKISGADGEIKPISAPSVPGLRIDYTGMQRSFQFVNGKSWSGIIFTFTVSPEKPGKYKIPGFIYDMGGKKVSTRELPLTVLKGSTFAQTKSDSGVQAKLDTSVEASKRKIYVGEPVIFRYYLLSSGLRNVKFVKRELQGEAKGFVVKEFMEGIEDLEVNAETTKYYLYTLILIPAQTGTLEVGGGTSVISFDSKSGFFDFKRLYRISFANIPVSVNPLPQKNASSGFKGAVGNFSMSADYSKEPVKTFDEKKINITVKGNGNFVSLTKPDFEKDVQDIKILTEEVQPEISLKGNEITGEKRFIFTVIPEKKGELNLGPVVFTFFNPVTGQYVTLKTEDISFKVAEGGKGKASSELDVDQTEKIDFNVFYIIIIVVIIGGVAAGIIYWEKKRFVKIKPAKINKAEAEIIKTMNYEDDFLRDISSALFRMDKRAFLSASNNALYEIARKFEGAKPVEIAQLKDEIYLYRFGQGDLTQGKMEEILEKITKLKSMRVKTG